MANNYVDQSSSGSMIAAIPRSYKMWVLGLLGSAVLLVALGLWLAGTVSGVVQPWTGAAFIVALGLAAIVGASKTSSA